jgi:hypothetical protein
MEWKFKRKDNRGNAAPKRKTGWMYIQPVYYLFLEFGLGLNSQSVFDFRKWDLWPQIMIRP